MSTLPANSFDLYVSTARSAGCPLDQLRGFCRAGVVLQPKQLAASAVARLCDRPDRPMTPGFFILGVFWCVLVCFGVLVYSLA